MTARERTGVLPTLPPELWEHIFDFATCVPGTLIPDIYEHSDIIGPLYNRRFHGALRAARVTKRYLVRVCKQWWHLARRYLYQAIYIGRTRSVLSLCSTLRKYATGDGTVPGVYSLGSWTQRLDLAIRDRCIDFTVECECLAEIIRSLPNLAIVSFAITSSDYDALVPSSILDALRCNASSLRVLDWSTDRLAAFIHQLEIFLLKEVPHLRILRCSRLCCNDGFTHTLTSVHTLVVQKLHDRRLTFDDAQEAPTNIRELTFLVDRSNHDFWRQFTDHYGTRLTSVHLRQVDFDPWALNGFLSMIRESCPNLRRVTLSVESFSFIYLDGFTLPPVQYLGIAAEAHQQNRSDYECLFAILASVKDTVPTLRVVQFIDPRNVNSILTRHWKVATRALIQQLVGSAFRVECYDGMLLSGWSSGTSLTPFKYVMAEKLQIMGKL